MAFQRRRPNASHDQGQTNPVTKEACLCSQIEQQNAPLWDGQGECLPVEPAPRRAHRIRGVAVHFDPGFAPRWQKCSKVTSDASMTEGDLA
eukprot:6207641-Pleurochrysis_carterae.AAC.1